MHFFLWAEKIQVFHPFSFLKSLTRVALTNSGNQDFMPYMQTASL